MIAPVSLIASLEKAGREINSKYLPLMIAMYGTDCNHYRKINREEDDVYGAYAGTQDRSSLIKLPLIKILMSTTQWRIVSSGDVGYLDDFGYVYSTGDLNNGDVMGIIRDDVKESFFNIEQSQSLGVTTQILKRFTISNLVGE